MSDIYTWSTTAADNATADAGINWAEFMPSSAVNNSARTLMERVARLRNDITPGRTSTGAANSYAVTSDAAPASLGTKPFVVFFVADKTNSGAGTLTVNALAPKPLRAKSGTALAANDVIQGTVIAAYYSPSGDEYLIHGSGYHANALGPSIAAQHVTGLKVGDPILSLAQTPRLGRIRLTETTQVFSGTTYPELAAWLTGIGSPWGALTLPSAAGYFLRFAGTTAAIDTAGPRVAGSTQLDQNLSHQHGPGTLTTDNSGTHTHNIDNAGNTINVSITPADLQAAGSGSDTTSAAGSHNHSVTGGLTGAEGGDEVRVKNVAFHVDLIASAVTANSDFFGINGIPYNFKSGVTAADPGSGRLSLNNATLPSVTAMYISETGPFNEPLNAYLNTWDDSTSTVRGRLHFYKVGAVGTFAIYNLTGTVVDSGAYKTLTLAHVSSNGTFADGDRLGVLFYSNGDGAANLTSYTVAALPALGAGSLAYASNGRKNGEGAGVGTGVLVFRDATAWRACDTGATVAA